LDTGIAAKNIDGITLHKFFRLPLELFTYTQQQLTAWTSKNAEQCSMLQELNVLIIDEVSMVSAYLFELIDRVLRGCCHVDRPFGGKQLIVMGDFFQLPTVKVMAQKANGGELRHSSKPLTADQFCFESKLWGRMFRMDNSIELMENFRQKDASFISFLDHFRVGRIDVAKLQTKYNEMVAYEKKMRLLKSNAETQQQALAQSLIDETLMSEGQIRVRLCPLLERVSRYNQDREKRVADYEPKIEKQIIRSRITFTEWDEKDRAKHKKITEWLRAVRDGNLPASHEQWMANVARMTERKQTKAELFKRCFIQTHHEDGNGTSGSKEQNLTCSKAPPLTLQIGSRVMLLRNLPSHGLVHGSCGFVRGFQPVVSHFIPGTTKTKKEKKKTKAKEKEKEKEEGYTWMCPIVIFDEKPEVFVVKPNRDLHMCKEGFLMIEQIPLNIAWALTIHKAQGLSLQHVDAEIARIFEHGQAYVALSRATTWEGLRIVNLDLNQCNKIDPKVIQYYRAMFPHNPLYAREQPSVSSAVDRKAQIQIQVKPLPLPLPIQIQIKPTQDELLMLRNLVGSSFSSLSSLATTSSRATSSSPLQQKKEDARPQKSEPPPAESKQQPIPIPVPSPSPLPLMSFTASNQDIDNAIAFGFGAFFIPHLNKRMAEFTL
jgi:hypothetical protein